MDGKFLKKKKNWFARHKFFTAMILLLLILLLTVIGYVWSKLNLIQYDTGKTVPAETSAHIPEAEVSLPAETEETEPGQLIDISGLEISETEPPIPEADVEEHAEIINILLIGTDEHSREFSTNARSDSMILVSINKDKKTVKLVSLERGMGVPILEGENAGEWDLLTHIFRYGGAELLTKTVEHCFNIEVDHYVRVNFTTVISAIDAIGGIEMELTGAEAGSLNRTYESSLVAGVNHLDGYMALGFARLRKIDSDWQRVVRQRKVITAVVDKLKGSSFSELNDLLNQVLPLVQTNMTKLDIAKLMLYSPHFLTSSFDQMTIPKQGTYGGMTGLYGRDLFAVDFEVNNQILWDFLYGEETEETQQTQTP